MKKISPVFIAFWLFSLFVFGQTPTPTPLPSPSPTPEIVEDDGGVVKITTNLIQVDVVVTDKKGNQVTDLKAEDFEIFENKEKQELTNFSYVSIESAKTQPTAGNSKETPKSTDKFLPPVPTKLKPEQVRRTIALVVDDLGLSFESIYPVRQALKKYLAEQMQEGDLVAIIRTSGGIGALQSFTSDKRQLYAAIEKITWNPIGRGGIGAFAPLVAGLNQARTAVGEPTNEQGTTEEAVNDGEQELNNFREDIFNVGTLGAISYVVKGMSELPGRKAVVVFSDGFRIVFQNDLTQGNRTVEALRNLTEFANRSSVVIYTLDARGLKVTGLTAEDDTSDLTGEQIGERISARNRELFETQDGLRYLAAETGGRAFLNNNSLSGSLQKVIEDQRGYYLLGYQPDDETFDRTKNAVNRFNKLMVRVKRPNLTVRYRSGFFGVENNRATAATKLTPSQQISDALTSPFVKSEINMRLTSLFGNAAGGSFVRSFLYIQTKDLTFTDEPDGAKKATFDIVAFTFGDNGVPIEQIGKNYSLLISRKTYDQILGDGGFVYNLSVPIKKAGAYQLRMVLRDSNSAKIGSATQFIEVPNLKKNRLTLSGIALENFTLAEWEKSQQTPLNPTASVNPQSVNKAQNDTALRRFKRGSIMTFGYAVYNAKLDAAKQTNLQTQTRVFLAGKLLHAGKPAPLNLNGQLDLDRIKANGAIALGDKMQAGEYVLQVIVTDVLAKEKRQIATQWIDFEIVP